jgi:hypothetical protein
VLGPGLEFSGSALHTQIAGRYKPLIHCIRSLEGLPIDRCVTLN